MRAFTGCACFPHLRVQAVRFPYYAYFNTGIFYLTLYFIKLF